MAPRYRKNRPQKAQQIHFSIFAGNSRVNSIKRTSELPRLRAGQFGKSARPANTDVYERIFYSDVYAGIETWHWVSLEVLGRIGKTVLAFKNGRYVLIRCDYAAHAMYLSVVYPNRDKAMDAYQREDIKWHRRIDGT